MVDLSTDSIDPPSPIDEGESGTNEGIVQAPPPTPPPHLNTCDPVYAESNEDKHNGQPSLVTGEGEPRGRLRHHDSTDFSSDKTEDPHNQDIAKQNKLDPNTVDSQQTQNKVTARMQNANPAEFANLVNKAFEQTLAYISPKNQMVMMKTLCSLGGSSM